jgi:hypothetical protein
MTPDNSREGKDEGTTQDRAPTAGQAFTWTLNERIKLGSDPISRARRLDVDTVLARSVRQEGER